LLRLQESVFKFGTRYAEAPSMASVISSALSDSSQQESGSQSVMPVTSEPAGGARTEAAKGPATANGSFSLPDSGRTDDQKQCRKIVIRTGLRLAQKSGLLLFGGLGLGIFGLTLKGSSTVALLGVGLLLVLASLPLISIGKSLSRTNSPMLAAIDDPSLVSAMHVADRARGGRLTLAVRFLDDRIVQMAIKPEELAVLRAYYSNERSDLRIQASENPTRTIRPAVAIA
jgi:hypothetical protein